MKRRYRSTLGTRSWDILILARVPVNWLLIVYPLPIPASESVATSLHGKMNHLKGILLTHLFCGLPAGQKPPPHTHPLLPLHLFRARICADRQSFLWWGQNSFDKHETKINVHMPIKWHLCYYCSSGRFSKCLKTKNMHSQAAQAEKRSIYIKKNNNKTKQKTRQWTPQWLHYTLQGKFQLNIIVLYNNII